MNVKNGASLSLQREERKFFREGNTNLLIL